MFSDAIAKKEIAYDENVFTKLKDFLTPILRKAGFAKIKFETGKDVYLSLIHISEPTRPY